MLLKLPNTFRAFYGAFPRLHTAQEEAVVPILAGRDLVIQAATGSGKSEAVLAPCLERLIQSGRQLGVLYIIPTRALAMDLTRRFDAVITERIGLNLAIRTGDIKRTGGKRPDIMFITPESLDVALGNTNKDLKAFLFRVGIVIVDEVHHLLHQYRGRHLVHLFTRLERKTGKPLQKIAMSATIARVDSVTKFLNFREDAAAIITHTNRKIIARLIHLRQEDADIPALLHDLYHTWNYRKILIFANSRAACDRLSGIVKTRGIFKDVSELHYSNLKPLERKKAEDRFRKRPHALCIATSTLELGIDVGDVDAVLLFQPPGSVSAFLQRIGRANRRAKEVNFWGLCSGERAGEQVVRFLALLELGRGGQIEEPAPRELPSVLAQQVISCLYEKKEISLPALQSLFPGEQGLFPSIFASLEKKSWLKKSGMGGLTRGAWQYRNHLLAHKIWGNFPEAEVEYVLEVSDKAVADIPRSMVSQMDMGDRIYLSGRRLRILKINDTEPRKVVARPCRHLGDKQLIWLGMGAHVSFEVARAMGHILRGPEIDEDAGLFTRTTKLFQEELKQGERRVVLENGMDVVPGRKGRFHYRTFLGSAGNLVLEWSIREHLSDDDVEITSHEMGVECSHWICFEKIPLPVKKEAFHIWVKKHFKVVQNLVPLSIFWKTLPRDLMVAEITDFLFDPRVAEAFAHYLDSTSDIVSGDTADLEPVIPIVETREKTVLDIDPLPSLLEAAKIRVQDAGRKEVSPLERDMPLTLTASLVSDFFFHGQCQRRFYLKSRGMMVSVSEPHGLRTLARHQGIRHEQAVMEALQGQGINLRVMDTSGSEALRFSVFLEDLKKAIQSLTIPGTEGPEPIWISQGFLKVEGLIQGYCPMDGVGVPDLLRLSREECPSHVPFQVVIGVGDIKSNRTPGYHHKWQVAFYARLLEEIIRHHDLPVRVAPQGFLITPPWDNSTAQEDASMTDESMTNFPLPSHGAGGSCSGRNFSGEGFKYQLHEFDLDAYLAAFPMVFQTFLSILSASPMAVDHRLESHCISCDGFGFCHDNALENEEIQFLPGLTPGELVKLRRAGCTTLKETHATLEKISAELGDDASENAFGFTPQQQKKLMGWCDAFLNNHIVLHEKRTRLFPRDISRACIIHVEKEPLTGLPWVLGWQVIRPGSDTPRQSHVWPMETREQQRAAWQAFAQEISRVWDQGAESGHGTHLFHFGGGIPRFMGQWGRADGEKGCSFLWQTQPSPWTDLKQVFKSHFYMPTPGVISLHTLAHALGMTIDITPPSTLFHYQKDSGATLQEMVARVEKQLCIMADLYQMAHGHLESQWIQDRTTSSHTDEGLKSYLTFINEEKRLKENSILMLQEHPLEERMLRFRALGYLRFDKTRLGREGRFLSIFKTSDKTRPAKFRKGDFLKLVPQGMADIQGGFSVIIAGYDMDAGEVLLLPRSGKLSVNKNLWYSLEEDISDWNGAKLTHAATAFFENTGHLMLRRLLAGNGVETRSKNSSVWVKKWLEQHPHGLNPSQQRALTLPFTYKTSMIQGPPGTGKTHLLGWILISLILQAHDVGTPLRIGVSALTHQAIDTVLKKVVGLVNEYLPGAFPGQCVKWGQAPFAEAMADDPTSGQNRNKEKKAHTMEVEFSMDEKDLSGRPWLVLGGTGYGFYTLFNSKNKGFPGAFDWVIFDEASQVPLPQALLSLIYGRGRFLFLGDINQLPPIIMGNYTVHGEDVGRENRGRENKGAFFSENIDSDFNDGGGRPDSRFDRGNAGPRLDQSVLVNFLNLYPVSHQITLDTTYRMNREICIFPAKTWYKNALHPAPDRAGARLLLDHFDPGFSKPHHKGAPLAGERVYAQVGKGGNAMVHASEKVAWEKFLDGILDPEKPVVMVLTDHQGCSQQSDVEADLMACLAHRLMDVYGVSPDRMALISPHRAQNNAILKRLGDSLEKDVSISNQVHCLPLVDTVERVQGAERDVIFFGMTASDPDHLCSDFLNSPHRLNVAMTRAKTKLVVIGSPAFFSVVPDTESRLIKNSCFKRLLAHCEAQDVVFHFPLH